MYYKNYIFKIYYFILILNILDLYFAIIYVIYFWKTYKNAKLAKNVIYIVSFSSLYHSLTSK